MVETSYRLCEYVQGRIRPLSVVEMALEQAYTTNEDYNQWARQVQLASFSEFLPFRVQGGAVRLEPQLSFMHVLSCTRVEQTKMVSHRPMPSAAVWRQMKKQPNPSHMFVP